MSRPADRRPDSIAVMLDEAFVAAATVHEPSAAERFANPGLVPMPAVGTPSWSDLQVYVAGVAALLVLFLTSVALDRLVG